MQPRLLGVAAILLGLIALFFFLDPQKEWIVYICAALVGLGLFQTVYGVRSYAEGEALFDKEKTAMMPRVLAGLVMAVGGMGTLFYGISATGDLGKKELTEKGIITQGLIVDAYTMKRRRGSRNYTVKVQYKDQNGQEHTVEDDVSAADYEKVGSGTIMVELIHSSDNPELIDVLFQPSDKARYGK